jgi:hypothetical protein
VLFLERFPLWFFCFLIVDTHILNHAHVVFLAFDHIAFQLAFMGSGV